MALRDQNCPFKKYRIFSKKHDEKSRKSSAAIVHFDLCVLNAERPILRMHTFCIYKHIYSNLASQTMNIRFF